MWYEEILWAKKNKQIQIASVNFNFAQSKDGINWKEKDIQRIDAFNNICLFSRPTVIIKNGTYKMWYSMKQNNKYRIGYAESKNGIEWSRKDNKAGIGLSKSGWDSDEIEYPFVFEHEEKTYMLYNGNSYGKSGFGLAKLTEI